MTLEGIDVSSFQGAIDWDAVAAAGIAYAWAKVSEGNGFEDPLWAANAGPLAAPGPITAGAYHFARPDLGNSPEAEADWFWSRLTARVNPTGWLLALDLEAGSGDLSGWRDRWCARIRDHARGYLPGWYTYWDFALTRGLNVATPYWGWFAWPDGNGDLPGSAFLVSFQQYGTRGVPGIAGDVDADRFFGDAAALAALTVGGAPPDSPPAQPAAGRISAAPSAGGDMIGASFRPGGDQGTPQNPKGYRLDFAFLAPHPGGQPGQFDVIHAAAATPAPVNAMTQENLGGFFDPRFGVQAFWDDQGNALHITAVGMDGLVRMLTEFWATGMAVERGGDPSGWNILRTNDGKPVQPAPPPTGPPGPPGPTYDDTAVKAELARHEADLQAIKGDIK